MAAQAAPSAVGDSGQICLKAHPAYCIHSNGAGNQVTITNNPADYSNFTIVFDRYQVVWWQNGNGNCLREASDGKVVIENGPCSGTADGSQGWSQDGDQFTNVAYYGTMFTYGAYNNYKVWAYVNVPSGTLFDWKTPV